MSGLILRRLWTKTAVQTADVVCLTSIDVGHFDEEGEEGVEVEGWWWWGWYHRGGWVRRRYGWLSLLLQSDQTYLTLRAEDNTIRSDSTA